MTKRDFCSGQKDMTSHQRAARRENIAFLREAGTHDDEIERRLGVKLRSEERTAQRMKEE